MYIPTKHCKECKEDRIKRKLKPVSDLICNQCKQYWKEECKAYLPIISLEERLQRLTGNPLCEGEEK